jgi:hypothetical protein
MTVDEDEITPEQERRIISAWLAFGMARGIYTVVRRYAQLLESGRHAEADELMLKLFPSLVRRARAFETHYRGEGE